jgi:hypothetical protein
VAIGKSPFLYPRSKVRAVDEDAEYIFVLVSSSVCFAIPKSAFGSSLEAEQFAARIRTLLAP